MWTKVLRDVDVGRLFESDKATREFNGTLVIGPKVAIMLGSSGEDLAGRIQSIIRP